MKRTLTKILSLLLILTFILPPPAFAVEEDSAPEATEERSDSSGGAASDAPADDSSGDAPASDSPTGDSNVPSSDVPTDDTDAPTPDVPTDGSDDNSDKDSNKDNSGETDDTQLSANVTLSDSTLTLARGGASRLFASASLSGSIISWSVEDTSIAKLSTSTGDNVTVQGVSPGRTVVSARVGSGDPQICTVEVSGIVVTPTELELAVNETRALTLSVYGDAKNVPNWDWISSNANAAMVVKQDGGALVTAYAEGQALVTCNGGGYSARADVTVARNEAASIRCSLSGGILRFSTIMSDLRSKCRSLTDGEELSYLTNITINTSLGTLYDGYVSEGDTGHGVATMQNYYYENSIYLIKNITFVPRSGVTGDVSISYSGYSKQGKTFTGTIIVETDTNDSIIAYSCAAGEVIRFQAEDFAAYTQNVYKRSLRYVVFKLPASRYGTLYYNYISSTVYDSLVSSSTRYYRTSTPSISNITFVPDDNYSGTFSITFTGCDTEGTTFNGTVRMAIAGDAMSDDDDGYDTDEELSYTVEPGETVSLKTSDFSNYCKDETGDTLDYIQFTSLPSSSRGVLYYDEDTKVKTSMSFFRTGSGRRISDLSFVANEDYEGVFTIPFTGFSTDDEEFSGKVEIIVSDKSSTSITYSVRMGERVYFDVSDFSDASEDKTGKNLDYLRFTSLPSTARGRLYYGETTAVTTNTSYYRSGSNQTLKNVNFVAANNVSGTVTIPFTGYNTSGKSFNGIVTIRVSSTAASSSSSSSNLNGGITYSTKGPAISFKISDISRAAYQSLNDLSTIRFLPPDTSVGRLLTNYVSPGEYTTFDATIDYPIESLSQIYFLPKAGFEGTATITYLVKNRQGTVYSSNIYVNVTPPTNSAYFSDMTGHNWATPSVDFFRYYGVLNGTTPTTYEPVGVARRGAFIAVLSRMFSFPPYGVYSYPDVNSTYYYASAIASARILGITTGGVNAYFYPEAAITRQDAAVYLYRSLRRAGNAVEGSTEDLARFVDRDQIAPYAVEAMASLVRMGVFNGDNGRLNPETPLNRVQMAAILYRAIT